MRSNVAALIIRIGFRGVPYYKYSIISPKTLIILIKAPTLRCGAFALKVLELGASGSES